MEQLTQLIEKLNNEFVLFQQDNDRRLAEIEKKGRADPLTEEKVDKHSKALGEIQAQLDEVQKIAQRRGTGKSEDEVDAKKEAHRKAFNRYMRKGDSAKAELEAAIMAAGSSTDSDPDGGYTVPSEVSSAIETHERDNTPMRQLCQVISVSTEKYEQLVNKGGATSGWVDEREARAETETPDWAALTPSFGEIYANPGATQKMLDDSAFNIEAWLADEVGLEFGEQENDAFTSGNGVKKPKGILGYTLAASVDGTRAFGEIEKLVSGSSGNFVADKLIELVHKLKRGYRLNAKWMMSNLAVAAIRKLKDGQNNYLWQPSYQAGVPSQLLGYDVVENDDVPEPAADANAALFGDFKRAYTIVDVRGVRVLRDPFTNKPKIHFYTTKRVGGFVRQDRAVKVMTLSA